MATASSVKVLRGRWPSLKHLASLTFKCKPCPSLLQCRCISITGIKQNTEKFTKEHEWIRTDNGIGKVGITAYAQDKLGDVVYVDLPEADLELSQGDNFGSLESVKAVSDLHAPASGTVTEINEKLSDDPGLVNSSPYEDGWIIKVKLKDPQELDELMSKEDYEKYVREEEGQ